MKGTTMTIVAALGSLVSLALVAGPAAAADCNGTITQLDTAAGTFYVDDRGIDENGVWVYQASNNVPGLQSGGENAFEADDCVSGEVDENGRPVTPDTLIV